MTLITLELNRYSNALRHSQLPQHPSRCRRGWDCRAFAAAALLPEAPPARDAHLLDTALEKSHPGPSGQCAVSAAAEKSAAVPAIAPVAAAGTSVRAACHELFTGRGEIGRHCHRSLGLDGRG